jgi:hypothetical protein
MDYIFIQFHKLKTVLLHIPSSSGFGGLGEVRSIVQDYEECNRVDIAQIMTNGNVINLSWECHKCTEISD